MLFVYSIENNFGKINKHYANFTYLKQRDVKYEKINKLFALPYNNSFCCIYNK